MKLAPLSLIAIGVLFGSQVPSFAGSLGPADLYNAFIFNSMNQTSDAQGALAVGGDLTLSNYSVASSLGSSGTHLVVGGNLVFNGGSINGNAVVKGNTTMNSGGPSGTLTTGGSFSGSGFASGGIFYGGSYGGPSWATHTQVSSVSLPVDFAAAETQLDNTSYSLSQLINTGSLVNSFNTLTFTGSAAGLNVFSIDASTLAHASGINFSLPTGGFAVVNVTGATSATLPNVGFNFNASDVLWNLYGVDNVSMQSFSGSVLAPSATVLFSSGNLNGTLVAENLSGGGELHNYQFAHDIPTGGGSQGPVVPLPAAFYGGALLLGGMAIARRALRKVAG